MAKAKYMEWIKDPDKKLLLSGWARQGLSDEQIAKNMGISRSTLAEWKKKHKDISDAIIKNGKEIADMEVENSLFKKCTGYTAKIRKTFKLKKVTYENGKKVKEDEVLEQAEDEIYIQPDTKAIMFWLTNRKKNDWRYNNIEQSETDESDNMILMTPEELEVVKEEIEKYEKHQQEKEYHMEPAAEAGADDVQR